MREISSVTPTPRAGIARKLYQRELRDSSVFRDLTRRAVLYLSALLLLGAALSLAVNDERHLLPWAYLFACTVALFLTSRVPASSSKLFIALQILMGAMVLQISLQVMHGNIEQRVWVIPFYLIWMMLIPTKIVVMIGLTVAAGTAYIAGLQTVILANYTLAFAAVIVVHFVKLQLFDQMKMAAMDPLTGAHNRVFLPIQMKERYAEFKRSGRPSSMVLIDIDDFKQINDRYGHLVGDEVLIFIVDTIQRRIRATDRLFRIGGDEFVLIFGGISEEVAMTLTRDIQSRLNAERPVRLPHFSISCGVCSAGQASSPDDWLGLADRLAYDAKRSGGNTALMATEGVEATN